VITNNELTSGERWRRRIKRRDQKQLAFDLNQRQETQATKAHIHTPSQPLAEHRDRIAKLPAGVPRSEEPQPLHKAPQLLLARRGGRQLLPPRHHDANQSRQPRLGRTAADEHERPDDRLQIFQGVVVDGRAAAAGGCRLGVGGGGGDGGLNGRGCRQEKEVELCSRRVQPRLQLGASDEGTDQPVAAAPQLLLRRLGVGAGGGRGAAGWAVALPWGTLAGSCCAAA